MITGLHGFPNGTWDWTRLTKLLHNPLFRMGQKLGRLLNQQVTLLYSLIIVEATFLKFQK